MASWLHERQRWGGLSLRPLTISRPLGMLPAAHCVEDQPDSGSNCWRDCRAFNMPNAFTS